MLSATTGLRPRRQHRHLSDASIATTPCPNMRRNGKCKLHTMEQRMRQILIAQKQVEHRKKVAEVRERLGIPEGEEVDEEDLLRNEPPDDWNLDVLVAERMLKRCRFAHHGVTVKNRKKQVTAVDGATGKHFTAYVNRVTSDSPMQQLLFTLLASREITAKRRDLLTKEEKEDDEGLQGLSEADLDASVTQKLWNGAGAFDIARLPRILVLVSSPDNHGKWRCGVNGGNDEATKAVARAAKNLVKVEQAADLSAAAFANYLCGAIASCLKLAEEEAKRLRESLLDSSEDDEDEGEDFGNDNDSDSGGGDVEESSGTGGGNANGAAKVKNSAAAASQSPAVFRLQLLRATRCNLVNASNLVTLLKKHKLHSHLRALDLRFNKLDSLNFLFAAKSYFPSLLSLSLADNPITKKPDYREQLRRSLPNLAVLDGESIRRPPLALPYPTTIGNAAVDPELYEKVTSFLTTFFDVWESREYKNVDLVDDWADFAADFLHPSVTLTLTVDPRCVWFDESAVASTTDVSVEERAAIARRADQVDTSSANAGTPGDVAVSRDKVLHRQHLRALERARAIQAVLTPIELKQLRVMHVSIHNASRNILAGRAAVHKVARGPQLVMGTYLATLYPQEHVSVEHHLSSSEVQIQWILDPAAPRGDAASANGQRNGGESDDDDGSYDGNDDDGLANVPRGPQLPIQLMAPYRRKPRRGQPLLPLEAAQPPVHHTAAVFGAITVKPDFVIVTIHSAVTWRTPSMTGSRAGIHMAMDRTLTLVPYVKPADPNRGKYVPKSKRKRLEKGAGGGDGKDDDSDEDEGEQRGEGNATAKAATAAQQPPPPFQIHNDQITLRPLTVSAANESPAGVFEARSARRAARMASFFGMEPDDPLVAASMERSNSDAAVFALLSEATAALSSPAADGVAASTDVEPAPLKRSSTSFRVASSFVSEDHIATTTAAARAPGLTTSATATATAEVEIDGFELTQRLQRHNSSVSATFTGENGAAARAVAELKRRREEADAAAAAARLAAVAAAAKKASEQKREAAALKKASKKSSGSGEPSTKSAKKPKVKGVSE